MGQLGHEVGAGGGDQHGVRAARQVDVRHVVGHARIPGVHEDRPARQGLHGDGGDEVRGRLGHHHVDRGALFGHAPYQLGDFVAGDAPGQTEDDAFAGEIEHEGVAAGSAP
ncbi:hypothetical protein D3C77_580290 [compost metagenome]